jgi:hypothetical protein
MIASRTIGLTAVLIGLLAACQPAPPLPRSTTTDLAPEAARDRVAEALGQAGLAVERTAAGLRATTSGAGFVDCPPVMVSGGDDRRVFTQVSERRGVAEVSFAGNGRTTATWQTSYSGRYANRVNNTTFERACQSTGELEALIVRSLGG